MSSRNKWIGVSIILLLLMRFSAQGSVSLPDTGDVIVGKRKPSSGHTNYYINPVTGNDHNSGKQKSNAWKTFLPANQLVFGAGDRLIILSPGEFHTSLLLMAKGTKALPVRVIFAPGRYDLYDTHAYRRRLNISNTNDVPDSLKAIALCVSDSKHVVLEGAGAKMVLHAKMLETFVDHSENITIKGLSYDYNTPTVSEFKVTKLSGNYADLEVNQDSHYQIIDSLLTWKGEGWEYKASWYWQEFNPTTNYLTRTGLSLGKSRFAETGKNKLRVYFPSNPGFKEGFIYQTRDVTRDCAGIFMQHSKNLVLQNIRIYFMHGMGIVSQFCDNITMDSVMVKPEETSGRTCAAWADILHFSGCKGQIEIKHSYLSAANDDAVNVHGIHLRIVEQPKPNQLRVRFMHGQTYGFNAYLPGDSIELIHGNSLLSFGSNVITASKMINDRDILITLKKPITLPLQPDDAIENITWTPKVSIHHNTITRIPTRGVLVTTRRKVVIENNRFLGTASSAVLVEDDAEGWFESGLVKDLTIRDNTFLKCGEPVISIHPENKVVKGAVHRNISISGNNFVGGNKKVLFGRSVDNLSFNNNTIEVPASADTKQVTTFEDCTNLHIGNQQIKVIR